MRSTDLLSLPNVNPDAGFAVQMSIDENMDDMQVVSFQAALLYTSSKGAYKDQALPVCFYCFKNKISQWTLVKRKTLLLQASGGSAFTPCVSLWSILCQTFLLELMCKPSLDCWPAWVNNSSVMFLSIPSSLQIYIFPSNLRLRRWTHLRLYMHHLSLHSANIFII